MKTPDEIARLMRDLTEYSYGNAMVSEVCHRAAIALTSEREAREKTEAWSLKQAHDIITLGQEVGRIERETIERCAKVAEDEVAGYDADGNEGDIYVAVKIAAAIRAMGEDKP